MRIPWKSWGLWLLCVTTAVGLVGGIALTQPRSAFSQSAKANGDQSAGTKRTQAAQPDPWATDQTVDAAALVKEISGPASGRPVVVSVSPHALYLGGHVPGAVYQGPGFDAQAIEGLKRWAQRLPRSTNLVVYCGCCPLVHCPNLRPAFRALQTMGFTHLRALILPTNFYTDWYAKGYPTEKGS
jgi:thiosulfate/3-mercaptopyruvate sulfurtransferase